MLNCILNLNKNLIKIEYTIVFVEVLYFFTYVQTTTRINFFVIIIETGYSKIENWPFTRGQIVNIFRLNSVCTIHNENKLIF